MSCILSCWQIKNIRIRFVIVLDAMTGERQIELFFLHTLEINGNSNVHEILKHMFKRENVSNIGCLLFIKK